MFMNSGEIFLLVLLGSETHLGRASEGAFPRGRESVYFPEEGVEGCTGKSNRHLE